jgi:hypothetical protein
MSEQQHGLFHVTLTVGGVAMEPALVKAACQRLSEEQPLLLSGRYARDCAEICYWEEAPDCATASQLAIQMWENQGRNVGLPPWDVLALEVIAREVFHRRDEPPIRTVAPAGSWHPF